MAHWQAPSLVDPPYATFGMQTKQACPSKQFQLSNWFTINSDCSAMGYNAFYKATQLLSPLRAQQWCVPVIAHKPNLSVVVSTFCAVCHGDRFCDVNATYNITHMTVTYATAFGRVPISGSCVLANDAPFLTTPPLLAGALSRPQWHR